MPTIFGDLAIPHLGLRQIDDPKKQSLDFSQI
jgi:hypothetical protein